MLTTALHLVLPGLLAIICGVLGNRMFFWRERSRQLQAQLHESNRIARAAMDTADTLRREMRKSTFSTVTLPTKEQIEASRARGDDWLTHGHNPVPKPGPLHRA